MRRGRAGLRSSERSTLVMAGEAQEVLAAAAAERVENKARGWNERRELLKGLGIELRDGESIGERKSLRFGEREGAFAHGITAIGSKAWKAQ